MHTYIGMYSVYESCEYQANVAASNIDVSINFVILCCEFMNIALTQLITYNDPELLACNVSFTFTLIQLVFPFLQAKLSSGEIEGMLIFSCKFALH